MRVFVYGTLKKGQGNHYLLGQATFLGTAEIGDDEQGWALYDLGYYPGLKEAPVGWKVKGEVYAIDEPILERLDWLEGYTNSANDHYTRVILNHPEYGAMYTYYYPHKVDDKYLIESGEWQ